MIPGTQPSCNEADGGFIMCEVEEQQAALSKFRAQKEERYVLGQNETQDYEDLGQEEADETGFVPSALVHLEEQYIGVTIDAVTKPSCTCRLHQW